MLIGFTGCKESGKDTAARFLIDELGYTKLAFADRLKRAVAELFQLPLERVDEYKDQTASGIPMAQVLIEIEKFTEYSYTWREFLQRFGTEMGRNVFGQDFWVNQWNDAYDQMFVMQPDEARKVVVTDVRFQNEAVRMHFLGGQLVEIVRPGYGPDGHASEEPLPRDLIDATISNNGDIELLRSRVLATVKGLGVGVTGGL